MRRYRFLLLVLPIAIFCSNVERSYSQTQNKSRTQKSKTRKNTQKRRSSRRLGRKQTVQYHPRILSVFRLPGNLKPDEKQREELQKLLEEYGPKMQAILPYLNAGQQLDQQRNWAKQGSVLERRARQRIIRLRNLGKERQLKVFKQQIAAAKKEAKKIEGEIKREIASLLTDEQKKSLRDAKKKARTKKTKKSKKS